LKNDAKTLRKLAEGKNWKGTRRWRRFGPHISTSKPADGERGLRSSEDRAEISKIRAILLGAVKIMRGE